MKLSDKGRRVRQRVGPTVQLLREERGLTLVAIGQRIGLSPSHMSRIERGLTTPSYDVLARIADALGTDLTSLTTEETATKAVDADLDAVLERLGVSAGARTDLMRLAPATRAELARALTNEGTTG